MKVTVTSSTDASDILGNLQVTSVKKKSFLLSFLTAKCWVHFRYLYSVDKALGKADYQLFTKVGVNKYHVHQHWGYLVYTTHAE